MKNLILWIVIAVSLYAAFYLIHKRALEKSVFRQLYEYYKGEKERRIAQEAGFIAKYGEIENNSLLYRADRMILQSGLKKVFSEVIRGTVPVHINVNLPGGSVCSVWNHGKCILVPVFGSGSGDCRDFIRGHPVWKDL